MRKLFIALGMWAILIANASGQSVQIASAEELVRLDQFDSFSPQNGEAIREIRDVSSDRWQPFKALRGEFVASSLPIWFRVELQRTEQKQDSWMLDLNSYYPGHQRVYLYHDDERVAQYEFNSHQGFSARPIDHPRNIALISIPQDKTVTLYIEVLDQPEVMRMMKPTIEPLHQFTPRHQVSGYFIALVHGVIIGLLLYNLGVWFHARDVSYLFYSLFLLACLIFDLTETGYGFQLLWPNLSFLSHGTVPLYASLIVLTTGLFTHATLNVQAMARVWSVTLWSLVGVSMLMGLSSLSQPSVHYFGVPLIGLIFYLFCLGLGIKAYKDGQDYAKYFVLSWSVNTVGMLWITAAIASDPSFVHTAQKIEALLFVSQIILFSFALSARIRILKEQSESAKMEAQIRSQFMANMSHEIRTPMNGVLGMLELLGREDLSAQQQDKVKVASRSARNLLTVINDILDFSKIESGKLIISAIPSNPKQLLDDVVGVLQPLADKKGISLVAESHLAEGQQLLIDPVRLNQILLNLIGNGVKFTATGHVTTTLELTKANDETRLRVMVTDTGIGIAKQQLDKLFEPFSQGDDSTTRRFGGTGLGLSICKQLAELMDGSIKVTSQLNEGSTFIVELPVALCDTAAPRAIEESAEESGFKIPESTRILLVEDNEINQQVALSLLEDSGLVADVAEDGLEAIEILSNSEHPYDLILMDCQMPGLDGYETTRRIRSERHLNHQTTPIMAMTANASAGDEEKCLDAGMSDYLSKPIDPSLLNAKLQRWTSK